MHYISYYASVFIKLCASTKHLIILMRCGFKLPYFLLKVARVAVKEVKRNVGGIQTKKDYNLKKTKKKENCQDKIQYKNGF